MRAADPFGTAVLRASTLQTWCSSPTRPREDTAAEADFVRVGYRGRVVTELAQNAAGAAARDVADLDVPDGIRALDASVVDAATTLVLVLGPLEDSAGAPADLLDGGLTPDEPSAAVSSAGVPLSRAAGPAVVLAALLHEVGGRS